MNTEDRETPITLMDHQITNILCWSFFSQIQLGCKSREIKPKLLYESQGKEVVLQQNHIFIFNRTIDLSFSGRDQSDIIGEE